MLGSQCLFKYFSTVAMQLRSVSSSFSEFSIIKHLQQFYLMKPADMKLSVASAGTLLSFTFHWPGGTNSTWSSTN